MTIYRPLDGLFIGPWMVQLTPGAISTTLRTTDLDDLSTELNNIKAGCYIGEVSLNHLMFVDQLCALPKCTRVAKYT